jgi:nucleoside-diphosphate-sugar epimerase
LRDRLDSTAPYFVDDSSRSLELVSPQAERQSTILLVGGAGYIGSIMAANLIDAGYDVLVLDSLLYGAGSLSGLMDRPGFELHVGDSRDEGLARRLLSRSGAVVHFGEIVGDPACDLDPEVTMSVNYAASVRLAELAAQTGVERFIYPSSCSVYGANDSVVDERGDLNPVSLYGRVKGAAETRILRLATDRFHPTVFRLATVYGLSTRPRFDLVVNTLAGRAASEGRIVVHGGGQWRPFVHVADVADLLEQTLTAPLELISGEIFNLGSNSQNFTIAEVAEIVRERLPELVVDVQEGIDRRNYRVNFDKVANVLDFRPSRTVGHGVAEIVRAIENGHILNVHDPRHSNVRALVETDARTRLWRTDFAGSDPVGPFRPRDVEATFEAANVLLEGLEESPVGVPTMVPRGERGLVRASDGSTATAVAEYADPAAEDHEAGSQALSMNWTPTA